MAFEKSGYFPIMVKADHWGVANPGFVADQDPLGHAKPSMSCQIPARVSYLYLNGALYPEDKTVWNSSAGQHALASDCKHKARELSGKKLVPSGQCPTDVLKLGQISLANRRRITRTRLAQPFSVAWERVNSHQPSSAYEFADRLS